jgi:hypothetical protein
VRAAGALLWAALVAVQPALAVAETPAAVLAKYASALARLPAPRFERFEYSVEQVGPRNLSQTHRIYRAGRMQRDEILGVDGLTLKHPSIRIIRTRSDRYEIASVAPRAAAYAFAFVGTLGRGGGLAYVFRAEPRRRGAFSVRSLTIDAHRYLPTAISFTTAAGAVNANGRLVFGPVERYWLIREATVTAKIGQHQARERILWSKYDFPNYLPPSTFEQPRPLPTQTPSAL